MSDRYEGIVRLDFAGRSVPLQFTLRRVSQIGRAALVAKLSDVMRGAEGDGVNLAELLELASGGEINAADALDGVIGLDAAAVAVHAAWALARYGPTGEPQGQGDGNPLSRLWTSLSTLWRRVQGRA